MFASGKCEMWNYEPMKVKQMQIFRSIYYRN